MYSSYAAAFSLRAKPSFPTRSSYLDDDHHLDLLPLNHTPNLRLLLSGYLLRHSAHFLLSSARHRPLPRRPHCCCRRLSQNGCRCCTAGRGRSSLVVVCCRLGGPGCRCAGHGSEMLNLGAVCRRLEAHWCSCGGSGHGRLDLGLVCSHRTGPRVVGRAMREEVWHYDGGDWPQKRCLMECHGDWEEEEDEFGGEWEVRGMLDSDRRGWEGHDRCRDCGWRRWEASDYYDDDEYDGRRRGRKDVNERRGRFRDCDWRRWEQREYYDDEDDVDLRQRERGEGRRRTDFEYKDVVDARRGGARRYGEDDRRFDRRRERSDVEFVDAGDVRRGGPRRYGEDDRRFDRRRERRDVEFVDTTDVRRGARRYNEDDWRYDRRRERRDVDFGDAVYARREGRQCSNDDRRFARRGERSEDSEEEAVSLLASRHGYDEEYDYNEQDMLERKYSGERLQKSAGVSALREDDTRRASSSRNASDARNARKEESLASRVQWNDKVDQRGVRHAEHTSEERGGKYSLSVGWAHNGRDEYDDACEDARFVNERGSRTQDVHVINEDTMGLASSSKNTSILKHRSNVHQRKAASKDESRKSSQKIMEVSEVRNDNIERDSRKQRYYQEHRGKDTENCSSSVKNCVRLTRDDRRQIDHSNEVDQQVATLTDSRKSTERLMDISVDSSRNASKVSHSQRSYDEVRKTDIDDRSTSVQNITHVTRDKKRCVNHQVIHETDIDVHSVTHVDVSKVRTSDTTVARSSQSHLDTRTDVNLASDVNLIDMPSWRQEKIDENRGYATDSAMVRCSQSHIETGLDHQTYSMSALNIVDSTKERQKKNDLTELRATRTAIGSTSESHIEARTGDRVQSTSAVDTTGTTGSARARQEQVDLSKVCASDATIISSSQGHVETRNDNQVHTASAINLFGRAGESQDRTHQRMTHYSSTRRNDGVSTQVFESSDTGESLAGLQKIDKLRHDNMDVNKQQTGTSGISNDKGSSSLQMESGEEGSFMVDVDEAQRRIIMGVSEEQTKNETTVGNSITSGSSTRHSVNDSLLESAARLEKSSTFHVGQFFDDLHNGISDADTALTHKNGKSIMEGVTRSSSRAATRGPSDEIWDVQSATSQETFKTADKEEGSSAVIATNSASRTPETETAVARRVHKSLWAYVADIIRLGWIQRGDSHGSTKKSAKNSPSSNSQRSEGWFSSQEHDDNDIRKKSGSATPKDQQLIKLHTGASDSGTSTVLKQDSMNTRKQGVQIPEAGNASGVVVSEGVSLAKSSSMDVQRSGGRANVPEVGTSPKGGLPEIGTSSLVDVRGGCLPEPKVVTSSTTTIRGSPRVDTGKGGFFNETFSTIINPEEAERNDNDDGWRNIPSSSITPYNHPQTQTMMAHENSSASLLELPEPITGESTRFEEKLAVQEASEVVGTEGKDAELKRRKFQRNKQVLKETFDEWEEAYRHDAEQRKTDELFMREALLEAQRAADIWEVPVGAVLVQKGEIIARGCNLVEDLRDSTAHAEMICIREASNKLRTWRLADTTLYVTLEPCAMCAGAILQARINTVVWGSPNKLLGADGSWVRLFPGDGQTSTLDSVNQNQTAGPVHPFHPNITIRRGVLSTECSEIMQQFFHLRRKKQKPEPLPPPSRLPLPNHPIKFFTKMQHMFHTLFCM